MVKANDRVEFIGQIMDIIEIFLDEKGVSFPETPQLMRDAGCSEEENADNPVILYGDNYSEISDQIEEVCIRWGVLENV